MNDEEDRRVEIQISYCGREFDKNGQFKKLGDRLESGIGYVHSSHGYYEIETDRGYVLAAILTTTESLLPGLVGISRFDLHTYRKEWRDVFDVGTQRDFDILALGYWCRVGDSVVYEEPSGEWALGCARNRVREGRKALAAFLGGDKEALRTLKWSLYCEEGGDA